jgi:hypothetical protein
LSLEDQNTIGRKLAISAAKGETRRTAEAENAISADYHCRASRSFCAPVAMGKRWLPLEANPDVMNQVHRHLRRRCPGNRVPFCFVLSALPRSRRPPLRDRCSSCGGSGSPRTWGSATCTASTMKCSPWCPSQCSQSSCSTPR